MADARHREAVRSVPKKKLSVVSCQLPEKKKGSFFARISPALATNNWQLATRLFHRFG